MNRFLTACAAALLFWSSPMTGGAQNFPIFNMGYSGAGIGSDLLKVIDRAGLWRKHGIDVRTIYLSSGTLMAQTLSSGDIGAAGFDTPAMLNLALAGHSLKVIAVPINRLEPYFVVRNNIKTPADLRGKKVTISRFGSGSDIMTRVALRYWKLDPEKDVSFFQSGNTPTRTAALIAGHMDAALVSSTGVAKIVATGCCRVLADLSELPLDYANYGVVVSGALLKNQRENVRRFLLAIIRGFIHSKTSPTWRALFCAKATATRMRSVRSMKGSPSRSAIFRHRKSAAFRTSSTRWRRLRRAAHAPKILSIQA